MQPRTEQRDRDHQGEREKAPSDATTRFGEAFGCPLDADERGSSSAVNRAGHDRPVQHEADVEETVDEIRRRPSRRPPAGQADVVDDLFGTGNEVRIDGSGEDR